MSRATKNVRMGDATVPTVANSQLPKHGSYCAPNSVPHVKNAIAIKGGNKPSMKAPKNSVALRKGR